MYQSLSLFGTERGYQLLFFIEYATTRREHDELIRLQSHSNFRGNLFGRQVEYFTGERMAKIRQQDNLPTIKLVLNVVSLNLSHLAGKMEIDTVDDTVGLGCYVVSMAHTDVSAIHRGIAEPHGKTGLQIDGEFSNGALDNLHMVCFGDSQGILIDRDLTGLLKRRGDLGPRTMNENQFDAQAVQQSQVMDDSAQIMVSERIAAEVYDKGFAAMSVDIGSRGAEPGYQCFFIRHAVYPAAQYLRISFCRRPTVGSSRSSDRYSSG